MFEEICVVLAGEGGEWREVERREEGREGRKDEGRETERRHLKNYAFNTFHFLYFACPQ